MDVDVSSHRGSDGVPVSRDVSLPGMSPSPPVGLL